MPGRIIPLISGEVYHILNRGVASQPIFLNKRDYQRFLNSLFYYQNQETPVRYSKFLTLSVEERGSIWRDFQKQKKLLVRIIAFCLMPNHFHLILRQEREEGIAKFLAILCNSYSRYFNTKRKRKGPLFEGKFKAVRIENDEQLLHVVRYVHLNPYTSYVVKKVEKILSYPYSSMRLYLNSGEERVERGVVLSHFKNLKAFEEFTLSQAEYQRKLEEIKHLLLED